jgi:gluconokinase
MEPLLIAVGGLIGTGKSTLAKALAEKQGAEFLRSDVIRKELAKGALKPLSRRGIYKGLYSPSFTQHTYKIMLSRAENFLKQGRNVVIDASFSKKLFRKQLIKFIETILPDKLILKRLKQRPKGISDAGPQLLAPFKKNYEPPTEIRAYKVMTIGSKKNILKKVLASLGPSL